MSLTESALPSLDEPPVDRVPPSRVRRALTRQLAGRHAVAALVADTAVNASMTAVGFLPALLRKGQSLDGATARALTEYFNCTIYSYDPDSILCIGGYVHSGYCNAAKWHREDDNPAGPCPNWYLGSLQTRCNGRAAWRWAYAGVTYRCADGEMWYKPCGATTFTHYYTICAARL
jgi:hypothetical protein